MERISHACTRSCAEFLLILPPGNDRLVAAKLPYSQYMRRSILVNARRALNHSGRPPIPDDNAVPRGPYEVYYIYMMSSLILLTALARSEDGNAIGSVRPPSF